MADIATLGMKIDAREAREGTAALRDLEAQGARTERRFITLAEFDARRARTMAINNRALRERAQTEREVAALMNQTATATEAVGTKSRLAGAPIARLNNSMVVLTRQAAGAHPVVGQLADAIGTFAIGTARMVPVLAGLAATAAAINLITRESREAKAELERQLNVLREIARERDIERRGGSQRIALEAGRAEAASIAAALRGSLAPGDPSLGTLYAPVAGANTEQLLERLREQNRLNREAAALLEEADRAERAAERRRRMRVRNQVEAAADAYRQRRLRETAGFLPPDFDQVISEQVAADQRAFERAMRRRQFEVDIVGGFSPYRVDAAPGSGVAAGIGQKEYEEALLREIELTEQRARAYDALTRGLYEAGRAYGGMIDQILSLTALSIDLHRSGRIGGWRGVAAAGLTGIGIGASTGNVGLGTIGGAAAGLATAGPWGALAGAVGGLASSLLESGKRAEEARRIWRVALEDFSTMFEELTPQERAIRNIERQREELLANVFEGHSTWDLEGIQQGIEAIDEAYRKNIEAAKELADAERELYDARFTALNSPYGFNLAYAGYRAGGLFTAPSAPPGPSVPGTPNEPVVVQVFVDGEEVSAKVEKRQTRKAYLGASGAAVTNR